MKNMGLFFLLFPLEEVQFAIAWNNKNPGELASRKLI